MCLAIPMKVIKIERPFAEVESAGAFKRKINIQLLAGLKIGDYVLVHAGFAIEKIDADKARQTLRLVDEIR